LPEVSNRMNQNQIPTDKIYVIAEIGVNHDGSFEKAKKLIDVAKSSGANAAKFQTFKTSRLASKTTPKVPYQLLHIESSSHYEMLESLELSYSHHEKLYRYCIEQEIDFLSTPYSIEDAMFLNELGVKYFKVASADIVDLPLLETISQFKKPAILSTGMANENEIEQATSTLGAKGVQVSLLHCTSQYPTPHYDASMARMITLKKFNTRSIGFSDHTEDSIAAIMSVALGAKIIEKHITLDINDSGPDHKTSMSPSHFIEYINDIRTAEISLGKQSFGRTEDENLMALTSRKSLHSSKALRRGTVVRLEDFVLLRPGSGIYFAEVEKLIGRKLKIDIEKTHMFSLEDFE
jgi:N,N'-diacetyllegionaminate synthase